MSEPLFESANSALHFAFKFSDQVYEPPLMNRMAWGPMESMGKGLGKLDGAGQAGMILSRLSGLNARQQLVIFALYSPQSMPCGCGAPCCRGFIKNPFWEEAVNALGHIAAAEVLRGCTTNRALRNGIIKKILGVKGIVLADLADKCHVSQDTATNHNNKIKRWLLGPKRYDESELGLIEASRRVAEAALAEANMIETAENS